MSPIERVVIVGAGLAGARAAEALRKDGYDGAITLLGDEADRPYIRPPLSKDYSVARATATRSMCTRPAFYDEQQIDLRSSTKVREIAPGSREVILEDGHRLPFDRLLLATGRPRPTGSSSEAASPTGNSSRSGSPRVG
jgi:3-phenylpropionate/trans-cinnamate dioxygenase ferredoxin reductase subunit